MIKMVPMAACARDILGHSGAQFRPVSSMSIRHEYSLAKNVTSWPSVTTSSVK